MALSGPPSVFQNPGVEGGLGMAGIEVPTNTCPKWETMSEDSESDRWLNESLETNHAEGIPTLRNDFVGKLP